MDFVLAPEVAPQWCPVKAYCPDGLGVRRVMFAVHETARMLSLRERPRSLVRCDLSGQ